MSEKENTPPEDLPEFLNTEPDTTGEGLICTETGERLSWEDLDRALEKPEKEWRPYSLTEWRRDYRIGDKIVFGLKNSDTTRVFMYCGYFSDLDNDAPGRGVINLGGELFTLQNLFDRFELRMNCEWQPFGVEDIINDR